MSPKPKTPAPDPLAELRAKLDCLDKSNAALPAMLSEAVVRERIALAGLIGKLDSKLSELTVKMNSLETNHAALTVALENDIKVLLEKQERQLTQIFEENTAILSRVDEINLKLAEFQKFTTYFLNQLMGEIQKRPAAPAASPFPSPANYGENNGEWEEVKGTATVTLNTLPRFTPDVIPEKGDHPIKFLGNVQEWSRDGRKLYTADFEFNGKQYRYTMDDKRYPIVSDFAAKGKPLLVRRSTWNDRPCVHFVWS